MCTKIKGEPIYEIVRHVPAHEELVVFYLLERIEDEILTRIQNTIYRQTMDSILEGQSSDLRLHKGTLPLEPPSPRNKVPDM